MGQAENIEIICNVIKTVPEKKLLIVELANSIPIKNGCFDQKVLMEKQPEIHLAIEETKLYGAHTIMAVDALVRLNAINEPVPPGIVAGRRNAGAELTPLEEADLEDANQF